jgi:hypothetical protein
MASPVPQSGRGQPHSKTLSRRPMRVRDPTGSGARLSSAAFLRAMLPKQRPMFQFADSRLVALYLPGGSIVRP